MSKEHAYAYEAGYRDGSIHYELEHCPACKNVADLQEALADNDRLREQVHWLKKGDILHVLTDQEYIDQCERERLMQVSIDALDKENAKLRELLEAVLQCAGETKRDKGCDACPMYNGPWRNDGTWCLLRPTLSELGMEAEQ